MTAPVDSLWDLFRKGLKIDSFIFVPWLIKEASVLTTYIHLALWLKQGLLLCVHDTVFFTFLMIKISSN